MCSLSAHRRFGVARDQAIESANEPSPAGRESEQKRPAVGWMALALHQAGGFKAVDEDRDACRGEAEGRS
jgi:hypothetical protein